MDRQHPSMSTYFFRELRLKRVELYSALIELFVSIFFALSRQISNQES
ncbi:BgTH12-06204 [Blumeria graminis f. sp. triticale]|uniref:BgTH12-06204 n=1 Tax=Blumeria graminis f. sp. triticale TaxID=1689686 RepID=A0A9W4D492_BLUGR|nr:BgTH12-06204 [Blumeria graminis f. sp. triticale]